MRSVRRDKEPVQFLPFALRPGFQSKLAAKSPADLCGVVTVHARIEAGADIQQAMRPQVQAQRDCSGVHVLPSPNSSLVARRSSRVRVAHKALEISRRGLSPAPKRPMAARCVRSSPYGR